MRMKKLRNRQARDVSNYSPANSSFVLVVPEEQMDASWRTWAPTGSRAQSVGFRLPSWASRPWPPGECGALLVSFRFFFFSFLFFFSFFLFFSSLLFCSLFFSFLFLSSLPLVPVCFLCLSSLSFLRERGGGRGGGMVSVFHRHASFFFAAAVLFGCYDIVRHHHHHPLSLSRRCCRFVLSLIFSSSPERSLTVYADDASASSGSKSMSCFLFLLLFLLLSSLLSSDFIS